MVKWFLAASNHKRTCNDAHSSTTLSSTASPIEKNVILALAAHFRPYDHQPMHSDVSVLDENPLKIINHLTH